MLLTRLLALLGLLLLAPVAQAAPGDVSGPGLNDIEALVDSPSRLSVSHHESDGPEGLIAHVQSGAGRSGQPIDPLLPSLHLTNPRHPSAQPRAPPFAKA